MPTPGHNVSPQPLRVGIVADAGALPLVHAALAGAEVELVGQAGTKQSEAVSGVPWFDDVRVLIAQSGCEAVVLHASPRSNTELGLAALERGLHVWRSAPAARRFEEAVELETAAVAAGSVYRVESWWESVADDVRWAETLNAAAFRPLLSELRVAAPGPPVQDWRANAVDAGGGVLMHDARRLLEGLLVMRGLPQRVIATVARCRRRTAPAARETEDVAAAIFNYADGGVAVLQALWDVPPATNLLAQHSAEASLELTPMAVRVRDTEGRLIDERRLPDAADLLNRELNAFLGAVRASRGRSRRDEASAESAEVAARERRLALAALLETIYLAARTGQPERPGKLYEVQGWPEPALR